MARARGLESPRTHPIRLPELRLLHEDPESVDVQFDAEQISFGEPREIAIQRSAFSECALPELRAQTVNAEAVRFAEVTAQEIDVVTWRGHDSSWREVEVGPGRIGSIDLSDSDLSSVTFTGLRVGYIDLRGATLADVVFERCTLGTLDLPSAVMKRVRFDSCTVDEVDLRMTDSVSVDLRGLDIRTRLEIAGRNGRPPLDGVWVSSAQARDLAPTLARAAGLALID